MLRKQKEAKPRHSSDESIQGKDFDTSTNYVCFFPKHLKNNWPGVFLQTVTDFCSLFSQVKYKTSEIKRTYLYVKIFGGVSCYFSKFTKCQLSIWSVAIFNQTQLKKSARGFLTGGEPFVTEFVLFCFQSSKYKNIQIFGGLFLKTFKSPFM